MFTKQIWTLASLLVGIATCMSLNITVDDQFGDQSTGRLVTYSPNNDGLWSQGSNCSKCLLKPNVSLALDGTWHDSTYGGQAPGPFSFTILFDGDNSDSLRVLSLTFVIGIALYVFCILAEGVPDANTATELTFLMDNTASGTFIWTPNNSVEQYTYNASVYTNTNISTTASGSSGLHNLTVLSTQVVLFDYAIYTYVTSLVLSSLEYHNISI